MLLLALLSLPLAGCAHVSLAAHPRPALPLPATVAARYALPGPVEEMALVPVGSEDGVRFHRGRLAAGHERAEFHLLLPPGAGPSSFVLCLPILAGGRELMALVAARLAARGHAVAWTERVASALRDGQRGPELEALFRRTIVHNRMVLAWARQQPAIDASRMGCVGISMGGLAGAVILAVEPDLKGGALCLAGADLPDLVLASAEDRAVSWRRWRWREDGLGQGELEVELARCLLSDPGRLGPYVATDKVLLVGGTLDRVVPRRHQDALWESLGRPERRLYPLGHYTAAVAIGAILGEVDAFLRRRFGA